MLLVFDVGNTNTVIGVFRGKELITHWRIRTDHLRTADEYGMELYNLFRYNGLEMGDVKDVAISSVVPTLMMDMNKMCRSYFNSDPLVVGPGTKTGLMIRYDNPREVGADRVVNAVAAVGKYGGPLIILDFGTATTFCVINEKNEYLGGAIAPGVQISTDALFARASKLPRVELIRPKTMIGKNTVMAMQIGIMYGFVGQVEGIVNRMKEEMQCNPKVVATGGLGRLIAKETDCMDVVDEFLTLEGLRMVYEINRGEIC